LSRRACAGLLLLAACSGAGRAAPRSERPAIPTAPVSLRVELLDGSTLTLGSLRGQVVLVHLIDPAGAPSLLEVPRLIHLAKQHHDAPFKIVCVAFDDQPAAVRIFGETFEIPYALGMVDDPQSLAGPAGPFGPIGILPTSILLDKDGRIAARMDGRWAPGVLEEAVRRLLAR
jgi:hypothetical protein